MKMASVEYVFKYCDIPSNITILRILATEERKWQEGEGMKRRDMKDKRGKRVHMRACTFCDRGLRGHRVIFLALTLETVDELRCRALCWCDLAPVKRLPPPLVLCSADVGAAQPHQGSVSLRGARLC